MFIQVQEEVEAQYVPLEDEEQLTAAHVVALQDNGDNNSDQHAVDPQLSQTGTCF